MGGGVGGGGRDESCYRSSIEVRGWEGWGCERGWDESGPEGSAVSAMNGVHARHQGRL